MIATNFSYARNNFEEVCDRVVQDSDIAIITRKKDENVVLMSQTQYDISLGKLDLSFVRSLIVPGGNVKNIEEKKTLDVIEKLNEKKFSLQVFVQVLIY